MAREDDAATARAAAIMRTLQLGGHANVLRATRVAGPPGREDVVGLVRDGRGRTTASSPVAELRVTPSGRPVLSPTHGASAEDLRAMRDLDRRIDELDRVGRLVAAHPGAGIPALRKFYVDFRFSLAALRQGLRVMSTYSSRTPIRYPQWASLAPSSSTER